MPKTPRQHNSGNPSSELEQGETNEGQRIDKWLWYIRAVKSRTLAAGLVNDGKVRINRQPITKVSQLVKPGDVVTLSTRGHVRVIQVLAIGQRRGPATEAATLYFELTEQPAQRGETAGSTPAPAARSRGTGRPTKRDRRLIDNLAGRRK